MMNWNSISRLWIVAPIALSLSCSDGGKINSTIDPKTTLAALASDDMAGRGTGTPGGEKAADFIAEKFKAVGLKPLPGQGDYFQKFELPAEIIIGANTTLSDAERVLSLGKDFQPASFSADGAFAGGVIFTGYGLTIPSKNYDDYAEVDLNGKIALIMLGEPRKEEGKSWLAENTYDFLTESIINTKVASAAKRGAVAVLYVDPDPNGKTPDKLPRFRKSDVAPAESIPALQITRAEAEKLLKRGSVKSLVELQKAIDGTGKPASAELDGVQVKGSVTLTRYKVPARNVVGYLPGSGALANEFVIVGAHYDHLGIASPISWMPTLSTRPASRPTTREVIFNGADDNASGTTTILALAERMARQGSRGRSIVFIAFTGEELGLLGSEYFVDHSPIPLSQVSTMINLDMVGRMRNGKLLVGGNKTAAGLQKILDDAAKKNELVLESLGGGGFGSSDHTSFALKKIPSLFFFTGVHDDYHRPTDDSERINFWGLLSVIDFSQDVLVALTTSPREPYNSASDKDVQVIPGLTGSKVSLGVIPSYGDDSQAGGLQLSGVRPGTAAEEAGLLKGDVLIEMGSQSIRSAMDLSVALSKQKPGDVVKLKILRDGRPMELNAKLRDRQAH